MSLRAAGGYVCTILRLLIKCKRFLFMYAGPPPAPNPTSAVCWLVLAKFGLCVLKKPLISRGVALNWRK